MSAQQKRGKGYTKEAENVPGDDTGDNGEPSANKRTPGRAGDLGLQALPVQARAVDRLGVSLRRLLQRRARHHNSDGRPPL